MFTHCTYLKSFALHMKDIKALLRTKVWFPNMDREVEALIKECLACQLNSGGEVIEPIMSTDMPDDAWQHLCMDFYGPIENNHELLVLIDEFSRFPVVCTIYAHV